MSYIFFNYLIYGLCGGKKRRYYLGWFGPSVLLVIDSPIPLISKVPWVYCSLLLFFFFFKHQGSKGRAVWGSEKANYKAFFQLILVFSSWGSSLPHTKTKLASVPQKILRDFVLITENCSESHKLSHLSCGIFRAALGEKASSL